MALTNFPHGITSFGVPVLGNLGGIPFTGKYIFVDPVNGLDGDRGNSPARAVQTLYQAHHLATAGNNDVVILMGNGSSTGTARLSLASAQTIDSTVTAGTLVWSKNATHLIGVTAPAGVAQRARIAPLTGTYTQATFGSGNFVTVTASGCTFANFSLFNGFSTGGVNQICWTDTGSRNYYGNVDFGGMADAASAADAGSRSVKIGAAGSGEITFERCSFGIDTVTRGAANATLEFAGGTPRNSFIDCLFSMNASASSPFHIIGTGAACMDRWQMFRRCFFFNNIKSAATTITAAISLTSASPGGLIGLQACTSVGATKWGDTNALANTYVDGGAPTAATTGLGVNPS